MTQTFTTRFTAMILAAAIVTAAWLPTVAVPVANNAAVAAATLA